jgi:hypothetical protein
MKVLDVELPEPLAAFYREVEALFAAEGITLVCERAAGPEFGGFYRETDRALVTVRSDLPPEATCHTLAHELVHALQRREGWPLASASPELGEDSPAAEVAAVLQALVHCAAAELRIAPLGLDASWEQRERHAGVRHMLRAPHPGANVPGTPAWAYWSLLYAYLDLLHPPAHVQTLLRNFRRVVPQAAATGQRATDLVRFHGYATSGQALAAMRAVHHLLRLGDHVVIEDPRAGTPAR